MSCGLFSIFDPSVMDGKELKWVVSLFPFVFFIQFFSLFLGNTKEKGVFAFFESISQSLPNSRKGFFMLFILALLLVFFSGMGLIPFTFTTTSHLVVTLSFSLSLWLGGVMNGFLNSFEEKVSHLLPKGSPPVLWPFLVLIESVSLIIRPFTLGIRLMANVMAGHLILSLIGSGMSSLIVSAPTVLFSAAFLGFEVGVALVQAYVFVSLMSLYWGE